MCVCQTKLNIPKTNTNKQIRNTNKPKTGFVHSAKTKKMLKMRTNPPFE